MSQPSPTTQHISRVQAVQWQSGHLVLLDQRRLPQEEIYLTLTSVSEVAQAIRDMVVRGAPAIGIAAAFGIVLAAHQRLDESPDNWKQRIRQDLDELAASRPTAVNLFWAIERMRQCIAVVAEGPLAALLAEAKQIQAEDIAANQRMGELGAALIESPCGVITHCNSWQCWLTVGSAHDVH